MREPDLAQRGASREVEREMDERERERDRLERFENNSMPGKQSYTRRGDRKLSPSSGGEQQDLRTRDCNTLFFPQPVLFNELELIYGVHPAGRTNRRTEDVVLNDVIPPPLLAKKFFRLCYYTQGVPIHSSLVELATFLLLLDLSIFIIHTDV